MSEKLCIAAQCENRSFTQTAAWISGRTHTLRTNRPDARAAIADAAFLCMIGSDLSAVQRTSQKQPFAE
jgi:hypothetical protein